MQPMFNQQASRAVPLQRRNGSRSFPPGCASAHDCPAILRKRLPSAESHDGSQEQVAYRLRIKRPGRSNESRMIAAKLDGSGTATLTLSIPMISSGDGSIALSSTHRSKRLDPTFQLPLNGNDAFDTFVSPTVL